MVNRMKKSISVVLLSLLPLFCQAETPSAQVGFSPEGSARVLVLNVIRSAKTSIRMMAYSFTAPDIMKELVNAKKRGVDVKIVIDEKGNRGKSSVAAMNYIANNGIPLRTNATYPIQHDKVIIVDGESVETGSFNYTASAEKRNSENAAVIWHMPQFASYYTAHWNSRWNEGQDYRSSY